MPTEPTRIKLNPETPSTKQVSKIPLPPLNTSQYDIDMADDVFDRSKINLDNNNNENRTQDHP